jgi:hypothetical protein
MGQKYGCDVFSRVFGNPHLLNVYAIIQKEGLLKIVCIDWKRGGSPLSSPPRPKKKKRTPMRMDKDPSMASDSRQEKNLNKASETNGAVIKPKLGASS